MKRTVNRNQVKLLLSVLSYSFSIATLLYALLMYIVIGYSVGEIVLILAGVLFFLCGFFSGFLLNKRLLLIIVSICFVLVILFLLFLMIYGRSHTSWEKTDVLIILGAEVKGSEVSLHLQGRLDSALDYLTEHENVLIVVSGGQGEGEDIPESVAMKNYLVEHGIQADRILVEDRSTSTYENLVFSQKLLSEYGMKNFRTMIVTSDYHIFRASRIANKLGISATFRCSETVWYEYLVRSLRECIAIGKYVLLGC